MKLPRSIKRRAWDLERFGLTPRKLLHRLRGSGTAKVLCVTLPKAGTHLLERALCLHPQLYRPLIRTINDRNEMELGGIETMLDRLSGGQVLMAHLKHREDRVAAARRNRVKIVFMIRDPRDVIVSEVHYVISRRDHPLHAAFARRETMEARLRLAFLGAPDEDVEPLTNRLDDYAGWFRDADLIVRFEDLVGASGGVEGQNAVVEEMFQELGVELDARCREALVGRLISPASPTFRRGRAGGWREHAGKGDLAGIVDRELAVGDRGAYIPEAAR